MLPDADFDPQSGEILSIECKKYEEMNPNDLKTMGISDPAQFDNCEATIFENKQIMCYKCAQDHFYDGARKICRPIDRYPNLKGCSLTFDMNHCIFCQSDMQMDVTTGSCVPKNVQIDLNKFDSQLSPGQGDGGELSANSHTVARDNNVFISGNNWSDESGADSFDGQSDNEYRYV